ncbi:MAG: hypothetical protein Q9179_005428 [Wetmoreana sp. 5 TL-2023]
MLVKTAQKRKLKQAASNIVVTETAQELDTQQAQQQSFEIVHALLHSSLAHLSYLRHLFPEECFMDRSFDALCKDAKTRYRDRVDIPFPGKRRKAPTETDDPSSAPQNLKVLVRNSSPGVNIFLGWLVSVWPHGPRSRKLRVTRMVFFTGYSREPSPLRNFVYVQIGRIEPKSSNRTLFAFTMACVTIKANVV